VIDLRSASSALARAFRRSASSVAARSSPVTSDGLSSSARAGWYLPIVCCTTAVIASGENGLVM
jgi:hypothetical protein